MTTTKTYTVGQTVFIGPGAYSGTRSYTTTIDKVGRIWVTLANGQRFDLSIGKIDRGNLSADQTVWDNEQAYIFHKELDIAWKSLANDLRCGRVPAGVTLEAIAQARVLLGLPPAKGIIT